MWSIKGAVFSLWLTKADSLNSRGLNIHLTQALRSLNGKNLDAETTVEATDPISGKVEERSLKY